ncbi:uncharacterized protein LOC142487938 isoform X3 [Ascaphus truei]|uniref:uncharacterized protein LOC142487938 isoform X3 n=1 Tax=Ascaphus truei TaxID=8439 RepID=UPI003F598E15
MVLQVALLLCLAASVLAAPLSDTHPLPVDLARAAADVYNQQNTGTQALFKLRQMKNVKKKIFDWGVHFTIGFTIKETHCWKNADYDLQQCKHRDRGQTMDCSLEVTVLDFVQEAPLNSVECHPLGVPRLGNKWVFDLVLEPSLTSSRCLDSYCLTLTLRLDVK